MLAKIKSDCGSVGRAVASNARGQLFESSHWRKFKVCKYTIEKTKIKKKELGNGSISNN